MRVEPHVVGSILHVVQRGTRGVPIVKDREDERRFVRSLYFLNDEFASENWKRDISNIGMFDRPPHWPERKPLVTVLAWTLMPNHFHLLLLETRIGGIAKFMQRLCNSMTKSYNEKYGEKGSLFQGSYRGKLVDTDTYLRQVIWYILVKNVLEMYPGGIFNAVAEFEAAWAWGLTYPYSSFSEYVFRVGSPITGGIHELIADVFPDKGIFMKEALTMLSNHIQCPMTDI